MEINANRYQKVVAALANRLRNKVRLFFLFFSVFDAGPLAPVQFWTVVGYRGSR
jgi:hypothetical protein